MVAVDGGGTKTEFVLFTHEGSVTNRIVKQGCNPNICGAEVSADIIREGVSELISDGTGLISLYAGCAGFASGDNKDIVAHKLRETFPGLSIKCETDIMNVVSAATDRPDCIVAICGTGMVAYAKKADTLYRMGGYGYLLDRGGSGFSIGRDALRAALAERDGSGGETLITKLVEERTGSPVWDHIGDIYKGGNSYIASFAPIVSEAYRQNDKAAEIILDENAAILAETITKLSEKYKCGDTVVASGGVITNNCNFRAFVQSKLPPKLKLVIPELPAIYGAMAECCKMSSALSPDFKKNFEESYVRLLRE